MAGRAAHESQLNTPHSNFSTRLNVSLSSFVRENRTQDLRVRRVETVSLRQTAQEQPNMDLMELIEDIPDQPATDVEAKAE